jgi:thioesterase domain-containing protein
MQIKTKLVATVATLETSISPEARNLLEHPAKPVSPSKTNPALLEYEEGAFRRGEENRSSQSGWRTELNRNTPRDAGNPPRIVFFPGIGEEEAVAWEPFGKIVESISLSYFDWTELVKPTTTLADLVSYLQTQIQNQLAVGAPLYLVGYSIGGPLAYVCALARQAEGRSVDCMAILDARASYGPPPTTLRERWEHFATFDVRAGLASVLAKLLTRGPGRHLLRRLVPLRHAKLPFNFGLYLHNKLKMQLMVRMFAPWWHAVKQNSELGCPTYVFRSEQHESWEPDDLGWGHYCQNVRVLHVTGSHETMLEPEHFGELCSELVQVLKIHFDRSATPAAVSHPDRS